jgi:hypothetical protein
MTNTIKTISELGKKVAMLKSNRNLDSKAVKAKADSLKDMEQLVPAVIVDATKAAAEGLGMVDFVTGSEIPENELENYVVLVDGNHRYKAYLNLTKSKTGYNGDFWVTYPLTDKPVASMIAEINIATNPWKGSDYSKCAAMVLGENAPIGVKAMNELTAKGCNISSASLWLVFTKEINKAMLTKALKSTEITSQILSSESLIERGLNLYHTAENAGFSGEFLGKRTFIEWIKMRVEYDGTPANDAKVAEMSNFINHLKEINKVKEIENIKGEKNGLNKEMNLQKNLNKLWDEWKSNNPVQG